MTDDYPPHVQDPPRLVVRRLPPLALVSVAVPHPRADVVPYAGDDEWLQSTTVRVAGTRTEIEALLSADVCLVRVASAKIAHALIGLPPERLALELDHAVDAGHLANVAKVPVGTVMVPTAVTDLAELKVLQGLPAERRVAVRIRGSASLVADVMGAIDLFGVDRLLLWTDAADGAEIAAVADAVRDIRGQFGLAGQPVEITY